MRPPVAKRYVSYGEGTPQQALHDALNKRWPDNLEPLFEKVGKAAGVRADTASGTLYAFLRGARPLPASHWTAYVGAGVPEELLRAVDDTRPSGRATVEAAPGQTERSLADRLEELAEGVAEMVAGQELILRHFGLPVPGDAPVEVKQRQRRASAKRR